MTTAIGYVRRSTDKQEESLDQQRSRLEAYAKAKGWKLATIYSDDAISGSDLKRPGLESLLREGCSTAGVEVVLVWDRNRLARPKDPVDGMLLERRLLDAGKRVVYAATGQEADRSFTSGLLSYVEHHQNGDYLRKLSRDTARGVLSRVRRGRWPGGPIPFGFDRLFVDASGKPSKIVRLRDDGSLLVLDADSGHVIEAVAAGRTYRKQDHEEVTLIPSEPGRVAAVRKMFSDYAAGVPARKIRDDLNGSGFRSSFGRSFCIPSVNTILENAAYVGRCVYNKRTESKWHRLIADSECLASSVERIGGDEGIEYRPKSDWVVVENAWEPIIDQATFDLVQERRAASREGNSRVSGRSLTADYLLTGLAVCGVCGSKLCGSATVSGKGFRTRYYVCSRHHRGDHAACPKRYSVPAQLVEDHVLGLIRTDLDGLRDNPDLHQSVLDEYRKLTGDVCNAEQQLQRRLSALDQQAAMLREHLKSLDASTAKALGLYDDAKAVGEEKSRIEQQLAQMDAHRLDLPSDDQLRLKIADAISRLDSVFASGTLEERRELISYYVQTIKADPNRNMVQISLLRSPFNRGIGVAGFEPTTS